MKRKNKGKGINSPTSQSHPNQPQCTVPVKPLAPYGFKRTPEIDRQLPVLLEYIQSVTKPEFIPKEIASASTILYAIQEGLVSRNGDVFKIESSLTPASLTDSGTKPHSRDEDCTVDPETLCCTVCGVDHSAECLDCGKRGYHASTCPQTL